MTSVLQSAGLSARPPTASTRQPRKIGIVSPYGYPHPGGVNEHVRFTYEAMRRMGHDVWIITSKYGRERESEATSFGSGPVGRRPRTVDRPRPARPELQAPDPRGARGASIRHPALPRAARAVPVTDDARRFETVNIGTFRAFGGFSPSYWVGSKFAGWLADKLDGRIAVSGAARHFISRYFPGEYRVIPNGVDLSASSRPNRTRSSVTGR